MNDNVYDVFMDDHVGHGGVVDRRHERRRCSRRSRPRWRRTACRCSRGASRTRASRASSSRSGIEKFSLLLQAADEPVAVPDAAARVHDGDARVDGACPTFCDWDFCPGFTNYREDGAKLTTSETCGFWSNYSSTKTELPKPIDPPDDDMAWEMPFVDPGNEGDDAARR